MCMACEICTDIVGMKQGFPWLKVRITRGTVIIPDRVVIYDKCPRHSIVQLVPEPGCLALCKGKGCMRVISIGIIRVRGIKNNIPDIGTVKGIVQGGIKRPVVLIGGSRGAVRTSKIMIFMISDSGKEGGIRENPVGILEIDAPIRLIVIPGIVPAVENKKYVLFIGKGICHVFEPFLLSV